MKQSGIKRTGQTKLLLLICHSPCIYAVKDLQPDSSGFPPQAAHSHAIHRVVAFKQNPKAF
ncbi:MAG: hypothetical protein MSG64_02070 [Pyrinomonadaceae bacterium MAG19_C2-C3]|nr:hypothetical protein [Pyrinomonadaceae bacterium MAG19_C2-C3]